MGNVQSGSNFDEVRIAQHLREAGAKFEAFLNREPTAPAIEQLATLADRERLWTEENLPVDAMDYPVANDLATAALIFRDQVVLLTDATASVLEGRGAGARQRTLQALMIIASVIRKL